MNEHPQEARFKRHVFVCMHERAEENSACCARSCGGEVLERLKSRLVELGLKSEVRANKSGCLAACASGATMVVYPEGVWYGHVRPEDVEEIVTEHFVAGRPVARLRLSWPAAGAEQ